MSNNNSSDEGDDIRRAVETDEDVSVAESQSSGVDDGLRVDPDLLTKIVAASIAPPNPATRSSSAGTPASRVTNEEEHHEDEDGALDADLLLEIVAGGNATTAKTTAVDHGTARDSPSMSNDNASTREGKPVPGATSSAVTVGEQDAGNKKSQAKGSPVKPTSCFSTSSVKKSQQKGDGVSTAASTTNVGDLPAPGTGVLTAPTTVSDTLGRNNCTNGSVNDIQAPGAYAVVASETTGVHMTAMEDAATTAAAGAAAGQVLSEEDNNHGGLAVANEVSEQPTLELPAAEQYDVERAANMESEHKRQVRRCKCSALALLIGGALVVILVVVFGRGGDGDSADKPTPEASSMTTTPTLAPTSVLSARENFVLTLLPDYTRDAIEFGKEDSPQNRAYQWVLKDLDGMASTGTSYTISNSRILQRFALATFYYSTQGESWHENGFWLNHSVHECHWFSQVNFFAPHLANSSDYKCVVYPNPCELPPNVTSPVDENSDGGTGNYMHLWMWDNNLQGTLPLEVYSLTRLRSISIYSNKDLEGPLPSLIGLMTNLEAFNAGGTPLGGSLPTELGLLSDSIYFFGLPDSALEGTLPSELGLLHGIRDLFLDDNELSGTVPQEMENMLGLEWLYLSYNNFTGLEFPLSLPTSLRVLFLEGNAFSGTLPTEIGLFAHMSDLFLDRNQFTGPIPTEIGQLTALEWLFLYGQELTGNVPSEMGLLTSMLCLVLIENQLTGKIPSELGQAESLLWLSVSDNPLTGTVPSDLTFLSELHFFNINATDVSGTIPNFLCDIDTLKFECGTLLCGCDCLCLDDVENTTIPSDTMEGSLANSSISVSSKNGAA